MKTIDGLNREMLDIRDHLQAQVDWRGPSGRPQGIVTLLRENAAKVCQLITNLEIFLKAEHATEDRKEARTYHSTPETEEPLSTEARSEGEPPPAASCCKD